MRSEVKSTENGKTFKRVFCCYSSSSGKLSLHFLMFAWNTFLSFSLISALFTVEKEISFFSCFLLVFVAHELFTNEYFSLSYYSVRFKKNLNLWKVFENKSEWKKFFIPWDEKYARRFFLFGEALRRVLCEFAILRDSRNLWKNRKTLGKFSGLWSWSAASDCAKPTNKQ